MANMLDFILARHAELEETARSATPGPWAAEFSGETGNCVLPADARSAREYVARTQLYHAYFDAAHIAANNPVYVLADLAAKRRLLRGHEPEVHRCDGGDIAHGDAGCPVKMALAAPFAAHADFDPSWTVAGG